MVGGLVAGVFLVRVAGAAQAELAARVLPSLPRAVPVEAKLRQSLADGGRGLLAERNPNPAGVRPPTYHLGQLPQAAVLLLEHGQHLVSRECPVLLPCLGVNRGQVAPPITAVCLNGYGLRHRRGVGVCAAQLCGFAQEPFGIFLRCSFHGLFFSALLCVFCLSPCTRKRRPQPSPVGVVFRGDHERAGWCIGRRREGDREKRRAEKAGPENGAPTQKTTHRPIE